MKALKITLIVVGVLVVLVVGGGFAAKVWFQHHKGELIALRNEGRTFGTGKIAARCVDETLTRHGQGTPSFSATLNQSIFLGGCLDTADSVAAVCATNPDHSLIGDAKWIGALCRERGLADPYCANSLQPLTRACKPNQQAG